jgi:hypothetical protein
MWLLINSCIIFLISNLCLAAIVDESKNIYFEKEQLQQCKTIGDQCQKEENCCSPLTCYSNQEKSLCLPSTIDQRLKRQLEDFIIPPYYNPNHQLYPYGISKPALPFYKAKETSSQAFERKKLQWDHCQFHEDCGEGNCCYVHFRFRSLPKWFCRPNRDDMSNLCEPLTKYRSLKDVPAWKQQQQPEVAAEEDDEEQESKEQQQQQQQQR